MSRRGGTDAATPRPTRFASVLLASALAVTWLAAVGPRPASAAPATPGAAGRPAFAAGSAHTCLLAPGGTLSCWGANADGQLGDGTLVAKKVPTAVGGLTGVTAVTAGARHTCALLAPGTVKCWGDNTSGQIGDNTLVDRTTPTSVSGLSSVTAITAGGDHTCALLANGAAKCWGANADGELGDGTLVTKKVPTAVSGLSVATSITAGEHHTCALLAASTARCWGDNSSGQVGDGTTTDRTTPTLVIGGLTSFTSITGGGAHTCATLANGTGRCWGANGSGQIGDNTLTGRTAPTAVAGLATATTIAAGASTTCATLATGAARCWGADTDGQLGNGTPLALSKVPVAVTGITNATGLAAGGSHGCATLANGTAKCWGDNASGQIGDNTLTDRPTPVTPVGLGTAPTNAVEIAAGQYHTCALRAAGTVKCWGANYIGQIGDGTTTERHVPTSVSGLTGAVAIATGAEHSCALHVSGVVKCWGNNNHGQLGDNTRTDRRTPVTVLSVANAVAITAGEYHTCARLVTGAMKCWGDNLWGQIGNGNIVEQRVPVSVMAGATPLANVVGITAGWVFTCARIAGGTARCWGLNASGQLGVAGSNLYIKSPTVVKTTAGNLLNVAAITAGESHACARIADGTLRCWGYNTYGQVGNNSLVNRNQPTALAGVTGILFTTVSASGNHSCARVAGGGARCWGENADGEVGDGTTTKRLVPTAVAGPTGTVAALVTGRYHTCTLTGTGGAACWGDNRFGQIGDNTAIDRLTPTAVSGL